MLGRTLDLDLVICGSANMVFLTVGCHLTLRLQQCGMTCVLFCFACDSVVFERHEGHVL